MACMWGYNYVVTPFGRFFARWLYSPNMGHLQNKFELGVPRRVWYHMGDSGIFMHPTNKIKENEFDFNTIDWLWGNSRCQGRIKRKRAEEK